MCAKLKTSITSEIGKLDAVILHTPGKEIENMTPKNAQRALYSDILNLSVAKREYNQFKGVLEKHAKVFEITDLLVDILNNVKVKETLIDKICKNENILEIKDELLKKKNSELASNLIEGVIMKKNTLTKFLNKERYHLRPLHNFFYTRDACSAIYSKVLINKMANNVRKRESIIMESIFDYNSFFSTKTLNPENFKNITNDLTIEGGDILVIKENILCIGTGSRTSSEGIDFIIEHFKRKNKDMHIIVQELPDNPESFIHLDMVFTCLDKDKCMVYEPLILRSNKYQTIHIKIEKGSVNSIIIEENILAVLKKLGIDLKPIYCGGNSDQWTQEREQWHSGANFFALAPGKVIGYGRNSYTIEEMNKNGFEILKAKDIISNKVDITKYKKYVAIIEGAELSRGGGGCRCMTMPIKRKEL